VNRYQSLGQEVELFAEGCVDTLHILSCDGFVLFSFYNIEIILRSEDIYHLLDEGCAYICYFCLR
jgi:hypothetical protein